MSVVPCWTPAGYRAALPCCGLQTGQWKSPESSIFSADTGDCMILWFRQISTINTVPETTFRVTKLLTFVTRRTYNLLLAGVAISEYFFIVNFFYFQNRIFWDDINLSRSIWRVDKMTQYIRTCSVPFSKGNWCATKAILLMKSRLLLLLG